MRAQLDPSHPRLLATLTDHFRSVNVARFSSAQASCEGNSLLASGSDDCFVFIFGLHKGAGNKAFGSTDAPNIENWKQMKVGANKCVCGCISYCHHHHHHHHFLPAIFTKVIGAHSQP